MRKNLFGLKLQDINKIVKDLGGYTYNGSQICNWIYKKHIYSFGKMTDISLKFREILKEKYTIKVGFPLSFRESKEDKTKKYLFKVQNGYIETAYIPERERNTLCISTQVGCKIGCKFCMTAKQGFLGSLEVSEILQQYEAIKERDKITNIVYMGMGEPLDNFQNVIDSIEIFTSKYGYKKSPYRLTISTVGLIPQLEDLIKNTKCNIAISLHSPFPEEREKLIPIEKVYPIKDIIEILFSLKKYFKKPRKLTFEYLCFEENTSNNHIKGIISLLKNFKNSRINLIPYNPIPNSYFKMPSQEKLINICETLKKAGFIATIRKSKGKDINAACGMLSTLYKVRNN